VLQKGVPVIEMDLPDGGLRYEIQRIGASTAQAHDRNLCQRELSCNGYDFGPAGGGVDVVEWLFAILLRRDEREGRST